MYAFEVTRNVTLGIKLFPSLLHWTMKATLGGQHGQIHLSPDAMYWTFHPLVYWFNTVCPEFFLLSSDWVQDRCQNLLLSPGSWPHWGSQLDLSENVYLFYSKTTVLQGKIKLKKSRMKGKELLTLWEFFKESLVCFSF